MHDIKVKDRRALQNSIEIILLIWFAVILYVVLDKKIITLVSISILIILYILIKLLVNIMFSKKNKVENIVAENKITAPVQQEIEKNDQNDMVDRKTQTVIASHVKFEGNLKTDGTTNIYGEHCGNITAENGQINLLNGGIITGNILCKKLVVDGTITGECIAEIIEVLSNGVIDGVIEYNTISIVKGGVLKGQINVRTAPPVRQKVDHTKHTLDRDDKSLQMKKVQKDPLTN